MLHLWMICLFAALFLGEALDAPLAALVVGESAYREVNAWWVVGGYLAAAALLACAVALLILRDGRLVDRTGRPRYIRRAHVLAEVGQGAAVGLHIVAVAGFGWLNAVRGGLSWVFGWGDVILLDELLAIAPALGVFIAGWWALYGIDRRCREAALMGVLDGGTAPVSIPTRAQFVISHIRHQMLMMLAPLALIVGWAECADWVVLAAATGDVPGAFGEWLSGFLASESRREGARAVLHFGGVAVILLGAPVLLRLIWETAPLPAGALRERLEQICAEARVRVRDILVWRTHGSMINGAVVGFVPWLRYILLTDALLDSLSRPQVEAVMAHEVAHARHRHMPWLAAVLLTAVGAAVIAAYIVLNLIAMTPWGEELLIGEPGAHPSPGAGAEEAMTAARIVAEASVGGLSLIAGLAVFGWASRRFEWQADAFAVQCLTRSPSRNAARPGIPGVGSLLTGPGLPESAQTPAEAGDDERPPADGSDATAEARAGGGGADGASERTLPMTPSAVGAMAGALGAVAALNGVPRRKRSWRHGSIAVRQARLRALAGVPISATPIDRTVKRIKVAAAAGLVVVVAAFVWLG